jgi:hypothetical protein
MKAQWGKINVVLWSTSLGIRKSCHFLKVTASFLVIGLSTEQLDALERLLWYRTKHGFWPMEFSNCRLGASR